MAKKDLIKMCRLYNGEEENPYKDGNKALIWEYEKCWVDLTDKESKDLADMVEGYSVAGLSKFQAHDGVPASLKALLFNRYSHWSSGTMEEVVEPFKKFYNDEYMK